MSLDRPPSMRRRTHSAAPVERVLQEAHDFVQSVHRRTREMEGTVRQRTAKVRQRMREQLSHQQVVKFFDKTGFMLGVLGLISTEFIFLRLPHLFWLWFVVTIPPLVALRWYLYTLEKYQFFLYDFCYFVQGGTLLTILAFPSSRFLWKLHYVLAHGPLLWAIPTWRNSFVFHSLDKVTSVFIHSFPALLTYVYRWDLGAMCEHSDSCSLEWSMITIYPLLYYFMWQVLYVLKTEVLCRDMLAKDTTIITSVRWMAKDKNHPLNMLTLRVCRRLRVLQPQEELDPETMKTKVIFWTIQLLYTLITFLPVKLAFEHQWANALVMWICLCICVWNGANYYIEVFSTRYVLKFKSPAAPAPEELKLPACGGIAPLLPTPESPGLTSENGTDHVSVGSLTPPSLAGKDGPAAHPADLEPCANSDSQ